MATLYYIWVEESASSSISKNRHRHFSEENRNKSNCLFEIRSQKNYYTRSYYWSAVTGSLYCFFENESIICMLSKAALSHLLASCREGRTGFRYWAGVPSASVVQSLPLSSHLTAISLYVKGMRKKMHSVTCAKKLSIASMRRPEGGANRHSAQVNVVLPAT